MAKILRRGIKELSRRIRHQVDPIAYFRSIGVQIGSDVELIGTALHTFGSEPYLIRLGNRVTVSDGVRFITHDGGLRVLREDHPEAFLYEPIVVSDNVFIGSRALILPGVTIGKGSVVGAGSVVTRSVSPGSVVVGVPARFLKSVDDYWEGVRSRVISTSLMDFEEKRRALEHLMSPVSDFHNR